MRHPARMRVHSVSATHAATRQRLGDLARLCPQGYAWPIPQRVGSKLQAPLSAGLSPASVHWHLALDVHAAGRALHTTRPAAATRRLDWQIQANSPGHSNPLPSVAPCLWSRRTVSLLSERVLSLLSHTQTGFWETFSLGGELKDIAMTSYGPLLTLCRSRSCFITTARRRAHCRNARGRAA